MLLYIIQIKLFLNISLFESASESNKQGGWVESSLHSAPAAAAGPSNPLDFHDVNKLQDKINKEFPGFEKSSGWKLQSQYEPIPIDLKRKLSVLFKSQNAKLFDLIGEDYSTLWA